MVMPIYDDGPYERHRPPFATFALIALNLAVFLYQFTLDIPAENAFILRFGMTPAALADGVAGGEYLHPWLTLIAYQFVHGDIFHLFSNMLFLWVFGDNIEDTMGWNRFLAFYLLCGIAGGLGHRALSPHSAVPLIGASGAVCGVVVAYLMVRPCAQVAVLFFYRVLKFEAYWVVGAYVLLQIYNLVLGGDDDVAYWAHLGGMAAGAILLPVIRYKHVPLLQCIRPEDRAGTPQR